MAFDQTAKLSFVLQAKDLASKTFKEARGNLAAVDKAAAKSSKSFGGLSKLGITPMNVAFGAAALGATVLVGGLISATKAAIAEEKNIAKLNASLKANIKGFDGNTDAIEKTIAKREDLAFSDDELRDSLATLVAATGNVDKAFAIQRTAMDLARLKGITLGQATEALTKVEAGSYRILKSLGIVLKDGATQTEALAAVQKVATGQAQGYADTVEGQMLTAQIKMDDAMEDFGRVTLPLVTEALKVVTKALDVNSVSYGEMADAAAKGSESARLHLQTFQTDVAGIMGDFENTMSEAARTAFVTLPTGAASAVKETVRIAKTLPGSLARALRDNRTDWQRAWDEYKQTLKDGMSTGKQIAKLEAILTSKKLAEGLRSGIPEVRAAAQEEQRSASAAIAELRGDAGKTGKAAAAELAEHLKAGSGKAYNAGKYLGNKAEAGFEAGFKPTISFNPKIGGGNRDYDPHRAAGGPVWPGGSFVVGEHGQEKLTMFPGGGGYVTPNARGGSSGGGTVIHVNFNSTFPPTPQQARAVVPELVREMRRQHVL